MNDPLTPKSLLAVLLVCAGIALLVLVIRGHQNDERNLQKASCATEQSYQRLVPGTGTPDC